MAKFFIPTPLRPYTDNQGELTIFEGNTVGEQLKAITAQYPTMSKHLFDESGELRHFINIHLKDRDIRSLNGLNTAVLDQDEISLILTSGSLPILEINCHTLNELLKANENIQIIDVREPQEYQEAHIEGSILIPLSQIPQQIKTLDTQKRYVLQCRKGGRSASATAYMMAQGFTQVENLVGGIEAWIQQINPKLGPLS